ncbi:MAG: hypothetical protein DHS20C15_11610 [Planctomycetota bacterium]|nr:MAG: hypothetical protein DHS20C15_11610 [Planctomycetota bacterium]
MSDANDSPSRPASAPRVPSSEPNADFLRSVRDGTRPSLSHDDHLRLGWLVLQSETLLAAIATLRRDLSAFAKAKKQGAIYNETITWVFAALINERIQAGRGGDDWQAFLELNADLRRGMTVVQERYAPGTLNSALARATFVLPDRPPEL